MNTHKKLTLGSFTRSGPSGSFGHTFSHTFEDGRELCLESCLSGYCVALYDRDKNIIKPKVCTETEGMLEAQLFPGFSIGTGEALERAVELANEMISSDE